MHRKGSLIKFTTESNNDQVGSNFNTLQDVNNLHGYTKWILHSGKSLVYVVFLHIENFQCMADNLRI